MYKVKIKLPSWKAALLSMAGRVQLVMSVIQSMFIHSMSGYSWPTKLLRDMEKWIKKIIWSGDLNKMKLVIVAWKKVGAPYDEGVLALRSSISLNEATNLKLCWDMLHSEDQWVCILRSSFLRGPSCINHRIYSSI